MRWRLPKIAAFAMDQTLAAPRRQASRWTQFYALTKPRVVQLIVFCAAIGMLLAQPGLPEPFHPRDIAFDAAGHNCVLLLMDPLLAEFRERIAGLPGLVPYLQSRKKS